MPRTNEQNEAIRRTTRKKIHTAGIMLFAKKGFAATNVKDIAREADISTGLMYRHYRKKEELFSELVKYAASGLKRVNETFENGEDPADLIKKFTEEIVEDLKKDDQYAHFSMLMSQAVMENDHSEDAEALQKQSKKMIENIIELIKRGQSTGQFKEGDPSEMAYMFFSVIQGMSMLKIMSGDEFVTPEQKMITDFLFIK